MLLIFWQKHGGWTLLAAVGPFSLLWLAGTFWGLLDSLFLWSARSMAVWYSRYFLIFLVASWRLDFGCNWFFSGIDLSCCSS
uniref:Uncharacterized protein n=1 Tax=Arundo donax TaxID=35708 RepID=A0A0A9DEU2_ARUDO